MASNLGSTNWLNMNPVMPTAQGSANDGGGGYGQAQAISYRDPLDAARSGAFGRGRTGEATYPDGYLSDNGALGSRREDRMGGPVAGRINDRAYLRGVHKGTKMDPAQYFWPEELNLSSRLDVEMTARRLEGIYQVRRQVPVGVPVQQMIYPGLTNLPDDAPDQPANVAQDPVDPAEAAYLARDLVGGLNVRGVR